MVHFYAIWGRGEIFLQMWLPYYGILPNTTHQGHTHTICNMIWITLIMCNMASRKHETLVTKHATPYASMTFHAHVVCIHDDMSGRSIMPTKSSWRTQDCAILLWCTAMRAYHNLAWHVMTLHRYGFQKCKDTIQHKTILTCHHFKYFWDRLRCIQAWKLWIRQKLATIWRQEFVKQWNHTS